MIPNRLISAVIILVSVAFAVNFGAQFLIPTYESDPAITAVFGTIIGAALVLLKQGKSDDGDKDGK